MTVTAALMIAVYAIVNGNEVGWTTVRTLGLLALAAGLLGAFLVIESRVKSPLVPLGLFRLRNVSTANAIGVFWAAAMFAWFFMSALYLQLVLGYSPLEVGLTFLPANLIMGAFSIVLSAKLVLRFGIKPPLVTGLGLAAVGLALFARAPVDGNVFTDVLPSMILLGIGAGMAFNPVLLAAMSDVAPEEAGLASGVVNTSFMMGGALGLAVLASAAASRTDTLLAAGESELSALTGGYHLAFLVGAIFAATAAGLGAVLLRTGAYAPQKAPANRWRRFIRLFACRSLPMRLTGRGSTSRTTAAPGRRSFCTAASSTRRSSFGASRSRSRYGNWPASSGSSMPTTAASATATSLTTWPPTRCRYRRWMPWPSSTSWESSRRTSRAHRTEEGSASASGSMRPIARFRSSPAGSSRTQSIPTARSPGSSAAC